MTELLAALAAIVLALLRVWVVDREQEAAQDTRPPEKRSYDEDMEQFDEALSSGNTDDLSSLFDELRAPVEEPPSGGSDPGGQNSPQTGKR